MPAVSKHLLIVVPELGLQSQSVQLDQLLVIAGQLVLQYRSPQLQVEQMSGLGVAEASQTGQKEADPHVERQRRVGVVRRRR